jgi:hypothetical protein
LHGRTGCVCHAPCRGLFATPCRFFLRMNEWDSAPDSINAHRIPRIAVGFCVCPSQISDRAVGRIGDVSKAYGRAFGVERWAYELFAEEVVRGGPAFAVSLVITAIEPMLRNAAALGAWQVGGEGKVDRGPNGDGDVQGPGL